MPYLIEVSGTPVAKQRPRGFKDGKGNIRFYTPTASKNFEYLIRERAEKVFRKPLASPIKLEIYFYMPRPKYLMWKTKPMPCIPHTKRPDLTNFIKGCEDGLNGVAYIDDAQISELHAFKMYHAGDEGPKTVIVIQEIQSNDESNK